MPRHKPPTARTEQKSEIIPAARVVDGVDGDIVAEQAGHETDRCDKPVQQAVPKSVSLPGEACFNRFDTGTRNEEGAGEQSGRQEQEAAMFFHQ